MDIFSEVFSRKLRNAVAHNQFIIHSNGNIQLINRKGNPAEVITGNDLLEIYKNLTVFIENMPFSALIDDLKKGKDLEDIIKEF
jgi:hypothetical protein